MCKIWQHIVLIDLCLLIILCFVRVSSGHNFMSVCIVYHPVSVAHSPKKIFLFGLIGFRMACSARFHLLERKFSFVVGGEYVVWFSMQPSPFKFSLWNHTTYFFITLFTARRSATQLRFRPSGGVCLNRIIFLLRRHLGSRLSTCAVDFFRSLGFCRGLLFFHLVHLRMLNFL